MSSEADDTAYRRLWTAVIRRQVLDALGAHECSHESAKKNRTWSRSVIERHKADFWLRSGGTDFLMVCSLADLDPESVRSGYIYLAEAGNRNEVLNTLGVGDIFRRERSKKYGLRGLLGHSQEMAGAQSESQEAGPESLAECSASSGS